VTDALVAEAKSALRAHELIKVKLGRHAPEETSTVADAIASMTGAEVVQVIGGVALLYAEPKDPADRKINIPGR
jgi:RNA-binding protein